MQSFLENYINSLISKVNSSKWLKVEFNLKKVFVVELIRLILIMRDSTRVSPVVDFLYFVLSEFKIYLSC